MKIHSFNSPDGFETISKVLNKSSNSLNDIATDASNVFRTLFNSSKAQQTLLSNYRAFITDVQPVFIITGDYNGHIAEAFKELNTIEIYFKETQLCLKNITWTALQYRIEVVKRVTNGIKLIMSEFTETLKAANISKIWLQSFGKKLNAIFAGVSFVSNETYNIGTSIGLTM